MKRSAGTYRVTTVPVCLDAASYRAAHQGCHAAGNLWNHAVAGLRDHWDAHKADPSIKELRHLLAAAPAEHQILHSHTRQAIADDLLDAVATHRVNKKHGSKGRAPWRTKNYRPLHFTRNFGWRINAHGKLNLSLGRGRPGITLEVPLVYRDTDAAGTPVPIGPEAWGGINLCWDRDGRTFSLHISHQVPALPTLDPAKVMAIDPGIINPMTLATETDNAYEVVVINGRAARASKHRRNTAVAALARKMSKCTKGSRQWRRYDAARKQAQGHASRYLRNIDHQVSRKAADFALTHDTGTIAMGDVRGIEQNTKRTEKKRFGRHQRRRLSQWSRGNQSRLLTHKTGVDLTWTDESYSSQTCPACQTRNRPHGRNYRCHGCGFTCHRDAVGALNILMRAIHGKYVPIDTDKPVRLTYLRATPLGNARSKGPLNGSSAATATDVAEPKLAPRDSLTPHRVQTGHSVPDAA